MFLKQEMGVCLLYLYHSQRNITQRTLLYHNTDMEVKENICNRKIYDVPKHKKHPKSENFFWPLLMEVIIRCLYLGCSKLPSKLA